MTRTELNAAIADAPRTTEQMLANRRAYLLREAIADVGATPNDFADFLGVCRRSVARMIARQEPTPQEFIYYADRFAEAWKGSK